MLSVVGPIGGASMIGITSGKELVIRTATEKQARTSAGLTREAAHLWAGVFGATQCGQENENVE